MSETKKYKILTAVRYLGDAFFYPFFSLYLLSTNLVASKIGFILSITPIIAILSNPIYSRICTNPLRTRNTLKIITIVEGVIIGVIPFTANFYVISVLVLILALFGSCHYGLLDSLTTVYSEEAKIKYSTIRIYGSIAYIFGPIIAGYITKLLGFNIAFLISGLVFIISGFLYQLLKPLEITEEKKETNEKNFSILKNKTYVLFVIFYVLLMGIVSTTDGFFSLYLEERGINSSQYGFIYAYFVIFEVITIIILNKTKKKINSEYMLLLASFSLLIRLICNYLYLPVIIVIIVSALRGIGYGIILHISFQYIIQIVGEKKGTFAIMLMTLFTSLFKFAFNNLDGIIIDNRSYKAFYLLNIILASITIVIGFIRLLLYRKNKQIQSIGVENV